MHIGQEPYRRLYEGIVEHERGALFAEVVRPWLAGADAERRWLDQIRARDGRPVPPLAQEESWRMYALSRVLQLLQLPLAPREMWTGDGARVEGVTAAEYGEFVGTMGLETVDRADFHPFWHEVVAVDELPDADAPPRVVETYWPASALGALLVSRAGCRVAAGRRHLVKEIAERSTMYWASTRATRPAEDPGAGWGGSSRWRTAFRRDYAVDGVLHYNAGAAPPSGPAQDEDLSQGERMELLRHRCFVASPARSGDRWPYDLTLTENG
jgi:hypothetical protein